MNPTLGDLNISRVVVAGSVEYHDHVVVVGALDAAFARSKAIGSSFRVLTGTADGADEAARTWAEANGVNLHAHDLAPGVYPDPMHTYNHELLDLKPDVVLAFKTEFDPDWTNSTVNAGTEHMCRIAARAGVPVLLNHQTWLHPPRRGAVHAELTAAVQGDGLVVVQGDITRLDVDVIVNAANTSLMGGGGVDGAIHRAAGPALLDECRDVVAKQGGCRVGEAVITNAGSLRANFVIHTVGPVWNGQPSPLLADCYRNTLDLADRNKVSSVAFPNISTGIYRYPKDLACATAIETVQAWLAHHPHSTVRTIIFCCFDDENAELYRTSLNAWSQHFG